MNKCSAGYYSAYQASSCTICPAGFQCADGTQPPVACPAFQYSIAGATFCSPCPIGAVCSSGIITWCNPGEICLPTVNTVKTPCPAGFYCPFPENGNTDVTQAILQCPLGTYSLEKSVSCTICPVGYFCPSPSQPPQACPTGSYQNQVG